MKPTDGPYRSSQRTRRWREPDSNHRYRSYERVSRLLPNGDAGPIDLLRKVGAVVDEVDRCAGAVFVAGRADRLRVPEAAQVLGPRRRLNRVLVVQQCAEHMAKEEFGVTADHVLRQAAALDQKEPVPAAARRLLVDRLKAVESRDDVERRPARNFVGMVAEQPMRHPRAAVVSGDREAVVAERLHHLDLIQGQGAFRIVDEILAGWRL